MPQVHTVPLTSLQQFLEEHGAPDDLHVVVDDVCGDICTPGGKYLTFVSSEEATRLESLQAFRELFGGIEAPNMMFNEDGTASAELDVFAEAIMAAAKAAGLPFDGIIIAEPVYNTE